jgi:hypothetical protein
MTTTLITGTGNPADVTELQTAVKTFDDVRLKGTFDFSGLESGTPKRVMTITKNVRIRIEPGEKLTIIGGEKPFLVAAAGIVVSFEGLHFEKSRGSAIAATAAADLTISDCTIKGVFPVWNPSVSLNVAAAISASGVTGNLSIVGNTIDVGVDTEVTNADSTNGMILSGPAKTIQVTENTIKNTTAHGIDVRTARGDGVIEDNTIKTGPLGRDGSPGKFADAVRCTGSGKYVVNQNKLNFAFENGAAVRLGGTSGAVITQNKISMSAHKDLQLGAESAGIQVRGTCENNRVEDNHIAGRARVALAAVHSDFNLDKLNNPDGTPSSGNPRNNEFLENNHTPFEASFADIEVGTGALRTVILARQPSLDDVGGRSESRGIIAEPGVSTAVATATQLSTPPESIAPIAGTISDLGTETKIQGRYELI